MSAKIGGLLGAAALLALLAGCERDLMLAGQRFDTRTPLDVSAPAADGAYVADTERSANRSAPVQIGGAVSNGEWSHRAGNPARHMPNVALRATPERIWSASIGAGEGRRARMATAPVVSGGRVFAIDAANKLSAISSANGGPLWSIELTPAGENPNATNGGGLAVSGGTLYATTGFGELLAIDAASGGIRWRQKFDGPATGAPAVLGDTVYVSGRDGGWAVNAANGKLAWVQSGLRKTSGVQGGVTPAVADNLVILPYSSGQIIAVERQRGTPVWQAAVAGERAGRAASFVGDLSGDPVVAGGRVYVGSSTGRTVALDLKTGLRQWEAKEGSMGAAAVAGNAVFVVSDLGNLLRLDAATGETVWSVPMGHFTKEGPRRQRDVVAHYGPVLAGGRLVVVSSDGMLRSFAPESGALVYQTQMPAGAVAAPAIAGGTLYVATGNGQVQAFR